jgi:Na+/H+ antiporter NhaD/arsenite permease-like protein
MATPFVPGVAWVAPFALLLLAIALLPLLRVRLWDSNLGKLGLSLLLGLPVAGLYVFRSPLALLQTALDYVSFMMLLGSLFVISGGVFLEGDLPATPRVNTAFLAVGAVLASLVGTTGASMLLIRPVLQTNRERRHVWHTVVFFIFVVSNVGGCLTPLGDPPLFLGYLAGVPFLWTLRLLPHWLLTTLSVLAVYLVWDTRAYGRETAADRRRDQLEVRPLRLAGKGNLVLLLGVVASVALLQAPWREIAMLLLALVSLRRTPKGLRRANQFSFHPILEVAALFAGLFATMLPALDLLRARGGELGLTAPWEYFWATGLMSSVLDNAPTYLTFVALAQGQHLAPDVLGVPHQLLAAISAGAVFMGANTYIGNGPNFMVKSIAEERGVSMPSFGRYMLVSSAVLLPIFGIVTLLFFR